MQLPDGWSFGLAQLHGGPQVYFWPSALPEQRWTTWRSPLEAPQLVHVIALEGHQRIERGDGAFESKWRVHGRFRHDDDKFMEAEANSAAFTASEFDATLWVSAEEVASEFEGNAHHDIIDEIYDPENDNKFKKAITEYLDLLMQTSEAADRVAVRDYLAISADYTSFARRREERNAQMAQDDARYDAIQAVAEAPAERLAAIMAAAAGRPAPAASPASPAAATTAAPAPAPRTTRASSSPAAASASAAASTASAPRTSPRSPGLAQPEPAPGSNAARKRPRTS